MPHFIAGAEGQTLCMGGVFLRNRWWHAKRDLKPACFGLEKTEDWSINRGDIDSGGGGGHGGICILGDADRERVQLVVLVAYLVTHMLNPFPVADNLSLLGMDVPPLGPVGLNKATSNIFSLGCPFGICFRWHNPKLKCVYSREKDRAVLTDDD